MLYLKLFQDMCRKQLFYTTLSMYVMLILKNFISIFQRVLTIYNSALYGAAVITTALDYFIEHSVMLLWVWDRVRVRESKPICWFSWALVAVWPFAFVLGKYKNCQCFHVKFVTYYILFILFCMFFSYSNWPWIHVFINFFQA